MDQKKAIKTLTSSAREISQIRGLYLAGSFGRGLEDQYSDVDFVAVADAEDHLAIETAWKDTLSGLWPIIFLNTRKFQTTLINAITEDWLRIDLIIEPKEMFAKRAKSHTKPLFEQDELYATLADALPSIKVSGQNLERITNEFIRVLGLLVVGVGREEYFTTITGTQILRDQFAQMLIEAMALSDPGGVLHMSKVLSKDDMALLQSLPIPQLDRTSIIQANIEIAKLFFPVAQEIFAKHGVTWPEAFETATQKHLQNKFGGEFDVNWMAG